MAAPRKPGRTRFEVVGDPAWLDQVAQAAQATERTMSAYARVAINEQMRKDGFDTATPEVSKPGRPKGAKKKGAKK